jgi:hypothetical protein
LVEPKVTNLFPKPNLTPHFGGIQLGTYDWPVYSDWIGVANDLPGLDARPSGRKERIDVLPSRSMPHILPFKGVDH